ncbi:hypothetical protein, partial [Dactylosporangium salmoneum]|uniref:TolB family protein n=1 Tax=Dactylosporangium salmoneum TaxID=53361 RepID=UPI0031DB0949
MNDDDLLRDSLARIGERAEPVDFLDRSLARSKRIGRNQRLMSGAAAIVAVVVAGGLAWQLTRPPAGDSTPAGEHSPTTAISASESAGASAEPSDSPSSASSSPPSGSVSGLPGRLYYFKAGADAIIRLDDGQPITVNGPQYTASVSPDGTAIAFMDHDKLVVTDRDGKHPHTLLTGVPGPGYEPQWSTDSKHLLAAKGPSNATPTWGTIDVASGTFTPLAKQVGLHAKWSADGQHIAYA